MEDLFRTTRWSVVAAAGRDAAGGRDALGWLFEAYRDPLYAFVRRRGLPPEDAADAIQSFFLALLERDDLAALDPAAGKFRAWLLAAVKNFLANRRAHQRAEKRRAQDPAFTVSLDAAEEAFAREASPELDAEQLYERRWALIVFRRALERLEAEFREAGRAEHFALLHGRLTGDDTAGYREVAEALGLGEGGVKTIVRRMRQRLGELMRDEVAQTLTGPADLDDEIRHLLSVL